MHEELIEDLSRRGLSNGTTLGYHSGLMEAAADALRDVTAQIETKDAENAGLKADLARVTAERDAATNEVCMKCKPSEIVEGLAFYDCDGCRWHTTAKRDEEE